MADKKKDRRRGNRQDQAGRQEQRTVPGPLAREYNYVLRVSSLDKALLKKYQEPLLVGTAGFAEVYYNYLFDNPDIADVLYTYERGGGDVGTLVRAELQTLLGSIDADADVKRETLLANAGKNHLELGIKPVWVIGSYHLLIDYLCELLLGFEISSDDRQTLESVLIKLLLRNLGLTIEGYWKASLDNVHNEMQDLASEHSRGQELLAGLPHLMWSVEVKSNRIIYANPSLHALYTNELEAPYPCLFETNEEDRQQLLTTWQNAVNGSSCHAEVRIALAGDREKWYRMSLYPATNRSGRTILVHCTLEDISNQIIERKQLEQLATTDKLTHLPNRALWADHLGMALAASRRVPGSQVVVISLDINQFKMYNDTLGRDVGDILLRDIAKRLDSIVRESDSLARLGGDQFGILLQPVNNAKTATDRVITQILDSFDMPFHHKDKELCVAVTFGIACFPEDGTNEETLLTNAESAMQRAKRNSLPYQYFDPSNDVSSIQQLRYSGQIRTALDNDEFELHYQPQVDIKTLRVTGAEALLRWEHPVDGTVMPARIIPVAEQLGMITPITNWVLVTALQQSRQWSLDGMSVPVSVNVSARSLQNPRLLEKIQQALQESDVPGDHLEIEITEATLMQDIDRAKEVLTRLSDSGVTIAIDDFGTGYSSLSYLKRLPIHTLKIDQSFIMDVAFDKHDVAIVRSIIDLGHNLGYKVVAEGVESNMAWDMLNNLGCDIAQGFHISKPLPDYHFSHWLASTDWPT
ncbi:MAG: EAL domain-containing protein [Gammaproteobacteria bacterium]|nr:EAL domain-containing protein [Gammaproteobacteria bacterium]